MLSDKDIRDKIQNQELGISPFEESSLTPIGYDLRVGKKGFSWKNRQDFVLDNKAAALKVEPHDTVVVETLESVTLSKNFGGTIHAMATLTLTRGLSQISTTVDPGWTGKLLISFHNHLDVPVELTFKQAFCTICFYQMQSGAQKDVLRDVDRRDIWDVLVNQARQERIRIQEEATREERAQKSRERRSYIYRALFALLILSSGAILYYREPTPAIVMASIAAIVPFVLKILDRLQ